MCSTNIAKLSLVVATAAFTTICVSVALLKRGNMPYNQILAAVGGFRQEFDEMCPLRLPDLEDKMSQTSNAEMSQISGRVTHVESSSRKLFVNLVRFIAF